MGCPKDSQYIFGVSFHPSRVKFLSAPRAAATPTSGSKPTFQQERALCKLWYTPCRAPQDRQKTASLLPSSATRSVFTRPLCEATAAADAVWRVQRTLLLASSSLELGTLHPRQTRPRTSWLSIQRPGWTKSRRHSTNSYSERILVFC